MVKDNKLLISIVVPCHNEEEAFPYLRAALQDLAAKLESKYRCELILIDDGSTDSTWNQMQDFGSSERRVRAVSFSRNFGHQAALTCGLDLAEGDAVITMDADLQDPPEVVLDMIREWEDGADIVYAVRTERRGDNWFKRWTASMFYRLIRVAGETRAPQEAGDFRLMSRETALILRRFREKHRYIRGMVGWIGFRISTVPYRRNPRVAGKTKYPLSRMIRFALDAIVSFSILPLRLAYILAILASLPFIAYLLYALIVFLSLGKPMVPGWSSLVLSVITFGSLILFCLGIMGEYLGRVYEQVKDRPIYILRETPDPAGKTRQSNDDKSSGI
jgi:dolichol-phosphate mannosyltransferase